MLMHPLPRVLVLTALAILSGCAKINDYASWPLTSSIDAVAIVNAQLLQGEVKLVPDRTGRVTLSASQGAITSCVGSLRFTGTTAGAIDLRCNDGSVADMQFALLSEAKGYAYGQTASGPVSLTFGLPNAEARAYLKVPANRKLVEAGKDKKLELQ
ncbi:MAG: hypothetical protein H7Y28_05270 [Rhodoferax sp.]|nr:hypothetical protein [Rhodoferax sp.]